jgi:hypothetical protein
LPSSPRWPWARRGRARLAPAGAAQWRRPPRWQAPSPRRRSPRPRISGSGSATRISSPDTGCPRSSRRRTRIPDPGSRIPIGVLLLVDARHPGLESDLEAWAWLGNQPCGRAVVGTKADKLTRAERARHTRELESMFAVPVPLVSARTGEGLDELWKLIAKLPNRRTAP